MTTQLNTLKSLFLLVLILAFGSVHAQKYFGEKIDDKGITPIKEVIAQLTPEKEVQTKIKGEITAVCQMKGCWMRLKDAENNELFIRFKDYGFFVPKDAAGKTAVLKGKAFIHTTSADELKHYAEDAGKSKEEIAKITEPEQEYRFLADGVIIYE